MYTCSASGWAKTVGMAAATISALPLGTRAKTLRMKCTRQRCQAAPSSTAAIAAFSPVWASEMTSWTPASPRAFSERRNAVQNAPSSHDGPSHVITHAVSGLDFRHLAGHHLGPRGPLTADAACVSPAV